MTSQTVTFKRDGFVEVNGKLRGEITKEGERYIFRGKDGFRNTVILTAFWKESLRNKIARAYEV